MNAVGFQGALLCAAMLMAGCTGSAPQDISESRSASAGAGVSEPVKQATLDQSEVASTSPVSSESEFDAFIEAWGSEAAQEMAKGFGVDIKEVPALIGNQARRIDLSEELEGKFPEDFTAVWTTDKYQSVIHVSAKTQEVLDHAKTLHPSVHTHLVKYSYREMKAVYDQLSDLLYDQLGAIGDGKSFVGFDPITTSIYLNTDGLSDKQKASPAFSEIQSLMEKHKDLIKYSDDYEEWGPGVAEAA